MTELTENLQSCPACQAAMDITGLEPLTRVACPSCGETVVVSPMIAHYELIEIVGRGGMGVVYKARDTSLDRLVALKVLRKDHSQDEQLVAQLETEASITASINHPHVVRVFTTGTDSGRFYIAMELVDKGTLDDLISLQGQVAEAQVLEIGSQIAQGLRAAYQHGLIHRDVKPGNILFSDSHTAKIVDFGLAMLEAAAAGGGEIWGTPYYVAPEKLDQKPEDFRSDMYSLGATLFHALAGRPPFEAEDATMVALKHLKSQAVSLQAFAPHISGPTAYVINRTLLKDPDQRYSSYDEFIEHLEYARAELEKKGTQPQAKQRVVLETEEEQKLWSYITFGMLGLVVLVGAGAWWYFSSDKSPSAPQSAPASTALTVSSGADTRLAKEFESAREQLLQGKAAEAAKTFHTLGADPKTPSPLAQWSLAHAGLAELLTGRLEEARGAFAALQAREMASSDGQNAELGKFFRELASLMSSAEAVPATAAKDFSRESFGAFAPLVLGLKDWQLAEFDEAGSLLRLYQTTSPRGEFSWVSDYKSAISDYLADFTDYRGALEMAKVANTRADQRRVSENLRSMSLALRTKGKLKERFAQLQEELQNRGEQKRKELEKQYAPEIATLNTARSRIADQSRAWKFGDARQTLLGLPLYGDQSRKERSGLLRKLDALVAWKNTLIAELPRAGSAIALRKNDGSEIRGQVVRANDAGIEIQGSGMVPWSAITPESLLAAAAKFTSTNPVPESAAQYRWEAGVFAAMSGLNEAAERLLIEAAKARPEYVPELPLLLQTARPTEGNLAKGAKATASDFIHTAEFDERPEKALDGDPRTKWCAKERGPKWLQVDLGEPKVISSWIVHHANAGGEPSAMNTANFELQASLDGRSWETVDRVLGNTAARTERLIVPTRARYVKLTITKPSQRQEDWAARIPEFELRGPSSTANGNLAEAFFAPVHWFASPQLTSHDIRTELQGSADINWESGEIVVVGAGTDIWGKEDSFQFAFQSIDGDCQIIARVTELERADEWSKAGLMVRESLDASSKSVFLASTVAGRVSLQNRPKPGADSTAQVEPDHPAPVWLKLIRQGDKFTAFHSKDGRQWQEYHSLDAPMSKKLYVGLAVTAHTAQVLCTTVFDFVQISETGATVNSPATTSPASGGGKAGVRSATTARVP